MNCLVKFKGGWGVRVLPVQSSLRLGIKKFPERFNLLWGHFSRRLPGQCKMAVPHQALLPLLLGSRTESREPLFPIGPFLALNVPRVFFWPERSSCSHHCTEHSPEELYWSESLGWSTGKYPTAFLLAASLPHLLWECESKVTGHLGLWAQGSPTSIDRAIWKCPLNNSEVSAALIVAFLAFRAL